LMSYLSIHPFKMHHLAARALEALIATSGFQVSATGTYRTYDQQVALFQSRYTRVPLPGRPKKVWNGRTYWQKPRTAMAAVPGTSNHGLGLAIDFATNMPDYLGFVTWLIAVAATFGFSAEAQSESWHWRYVAGDDLPQAVLDFENPPTPEPVPEPLPDLAAGIAAAKTYTLRLGSGSGSPGEYDAVRWLRAGLIRDGAEIGTEGYLDQTVEIAVKAWQTAIGGLTIDGVVGPKTWAKLWP
jgi:hypothetical protein